VSSNWHQRVPQSSNWLRGIYALRIMLAKTITTKQMSFTQAVLHKCSTNNPLAHLEKSFWESRPENPTELFSAQLPQKKHKKLTWKHSTDNFYWLKMMEKRCSSYGLLCTNPWCFAKYAISIDKRTISTAEVIIFSQFKELWKKVTHVI